MLDDAATDAYTLINFLGAGFRGRHIILGLRSRYGFASATDEEISQVKELISRATHWNASLLKGQLPVGDEAMRRPESSLNEALELGERLSGLFIDQAQRMDESQKHVGKRPHAWALVEGIIWEAEYSQLAAQGMLTLAERQKNDNLINRALSEEQQAMELRQFGESLLTRMIGGTEFELEEAKDLWSRCALLPGRFRVKGSDIGFMVGRVRGKLLAGDIAVAGNMWADWQGTGAQAKEIAHWNAYGFNPAECLKLRQAGLSDPEVAYAYRVRGLLLEEMLSNHKKSIAPEDIPFPDPVPEKEAEEQPKEEEDKKPKAVIEKKTPAPLKEKKKKAGSLKLEESAPMMTDNLIEFKLEPGVLEKDVTPKKAVRPGSSRGVKAGDEIQKAATVAKSIGATKDKAAPQTKPKVKKKKKDVKEGKSSAFKVFDKKSSSVIAESDSAHKKPSADDYSIEHIVIDMPIPGSNDKPIAAELPVVDLGMLKVPGQEDLDDDLTDKMDSGTSSAATRKATTQKAPVKKKQAKPIDPEWLKAKFQNPKEAAVWKKTRLSPKDARVWKDVGFKPEEAYRWVRVTPAKQAAKWKATGVGSDEAIDWMQRGVTPKEVKKRLARGESPDGPRSYRRTDANRALLYWGVSFFDSESSAFLGAKEKRRRERLAVNENLRCLSGEYSNIEDNPLAYLAVGDSFTEAGSGYPLPLKTQDDGKGWDKRLSRYCEIMEVSDENKGWWLAASQADSSGKELYQKTILLWGIPFEGTEKPPWADQEHDTSYEQWVGRLNRKLAESNYTAEDVAGCHIGIHLSWQSPRAYVAIDESCLIADFRKAVNIEDFFIRPGWLSRLKAFCEVMGIPWQDPDWYIAARTEQ